ncbi:hypothetical protein M0R45_030786 [Rubus argutus]|uniref:Uncharacterized protein n=1 Tax=Rubus argutus TaxID=59490 RepID=A0AAW1WCW1_RUBAR
MSPTPSTSLPWRLLCHRPLPRPPKLSHGVVFSVVNLTSATHQVDLFCPAATPSLLPHARLYVDNVPSVRPVLIHGVVPLSSSVVAVDPMP